MAIHSPNNQVFIDPEELIFSVGAPGTRSQDRVVLTVINPYDFPVIFHILCRDVDKYVVGTQRGTIKAKHRFDLAIRLNDVENCEYYRRDLFKVELYRKNKSKPFAERQFTAVVRPCEDQGRTSDPPAYSPPAEEAGTDKLSSKQDGANNHKSQVGLFVLMSLLLLAVCLWPFECEPHNLDWWPPQLTMNVHVKLLLVFILALFMMPLLRSLQ